MPRPTRFTPGTDTLPIGKEAGFAPGPIWMGAENLAATGIRSPYRPDHSKSLYRLCYPGPQCGTVCSGKWVMTFQTTVRCSSRISWRGGTTFTEINDVTYQRRAIFRVLRARRQCKAQAQANLRANSLRAKCVNEKRVPELIAPSKILKMLSLFVIYLYDKSPYLTGLFCVNKVVPLTIMKTYRGVEV
jgi:hypothetical protein